MRLRIKACIARKSFTFRQTNRNISPPQLGDSEDINLTRSPLMMEITREGYLWTWHHCGSRRRASINEQVGADAEVFGQCKGARGLANTRHARSSPHCTRPCGPSLPARESRKVPWYMAPGKWTCNEGRHCGCTWAENNKNFDQPDFPRDINRFEDQYREASERRAAQFREEVVQVLWLENRKIDGASVIGLCLPTPRAVSAHWPPRYASVVFNVKVFWG